MTDFTVEELVVPRSIDAPDAADFIAATKLYMLIETTEYGVDEMMLTPAELLPDWLDSGRPRRLFGVRLDGVIVGRGMYFRAAGEPTTAWAYVSVNPDHRNRGIGSALAEHIEARIAEEGRTAIIVHGVVRAAAGEQLAAPTGFGTVPLASPGVRFLLDRGYSLEQVERTSRMPLPREGEPPTPPADYRLHYWIDRVPQKWRDDMVLMQTQMSIDEPSAGLDAPEDTYTVERLLETEENLAASPLTELTTAVEHVATGRLAGYTTLSVPEQSTRAVYQDDTFVRAEHRGHRLGLLLKVANIHHLQRERPGHPSIITFNAEENRFMLDTNEAVGFVPIGYEGAWKKLL